MAIRELEVAVRRSDDVPVLDLVGDIDASAEAALQSAWDEAAPGAQSVILDFSRTSYINSTGIALIVATAGQRSRARDRADRARALRALPHDLRDHSSGRLHADHGCLRCSRSAPTAPAAIIDITGDLTVASEDALMDAYARASDDGLRAVVLNFDGLQYMNSSGIGLLVTLLVRAHRQGQQVLAYGLSEHYRQIFELTRLDEAVGIHDTEADALGTLS